MSLLTAAVVGLGQIGQGYDYAIQDDSVVLTHASAFYHHAAYKLVAGIDPNFINREQFERKFSCPTYADVSSLYADLNPDVVALAVPTALHFSLFQHIAEYRPRAIICEKPIASDLHSAKQMVTSAQQKGIPLLVNYMRRFEPGIAKIKQMIEDGELGDVSKIVGYYSKGILNNGSHLIDLLTFLFGKINHVTVIKSGRCWQGIDPEPDVYCQIGNIDVYLIAGDENHYARFELEVMGTKGVLKYTSSGKSIKFYQVKKDLLFTQYQFLAEEGELIPNDYLRYQWHVVDHLAKHLTHGAPLCSSGDSAYHTLTEIVGIINKREINQLVQS